MNEETWKPVVGYEGLYEVSDHGRVRSLHPGPTRYLKLLTVMRPVGQWGYSPCMVTICKDGKPRRANIARLVLAAFKGPCPTGMQACHFPDRDPANNHVDNLRWGTPFDNAADRTKHGTQVRGPLVGTSKVSDEIAAAIINLRHHGVKASIVADSFGLTEQQVRNIARGRSWAHLQ